MLQDGEILRWSTVAGSYSPNAFSIRLPAGTSPIDPVSLELIDDPKRMSVLVHEYWHYLQNLTTVAGFLELFLQQELTSAFSQTLAVTGDGGSVGSDAIGGVMPNQLRELMAMFFARRGELKASSIDNDRVRNFRITGVDEEDYGLMLRGQAVPLRKVTLTIDAEMRDGSHEIGQLLFGQVCVEEGIAYLVDRIVAGDGTGALGPDDAPPFPYWVLREIALTGGVDMSAIEIVSIGTLALLTPDPAGIFLQLRDEYVLRRDSGQSISQSLDDIWQNMRSDVEAIIEAIVRSDLPELARMHEERGLVSTAVQWLDEQYEAALRRRLRDPLFDLRPFSHNRVDRAGLNTLLRTILPCDIIIGREGPVHTIERDVLISFGVPGISVQGVRLSDFLRTLEAQRHLVFAHLTRERILDSTSVEETRARASDDVIRPCPFYTSCTLELRRSNASTCYRRPWRIFERDRPNCWYGSAVSCTLGPTEVKNVIRDPRELDTERERIMQAVRRRAYAVWEESGREHGRDWEHWFQAREELGIANDYEV